MFSFFLNNNNGNAGNNQNLIMDFETLQNARKDMIGEIEAIIQYDDHLHKTNIEVAKETWVNIRNEELVHLGELLGLICYIAPYQKPLIEKGLKEFDERLKKG